jgi:hypothetical protein
MRLFLRALILGCLAATAATAQPRPRARAPRVALRAAPTMPLTPAAPAVPRTVRDRFRGTVLIGATVGVGSPRGFAGGFIELRPWRALGVSVGGGAGGGFGPSLDVTALLAPLGGRSWALGVEGAYSHQFSYGVGLSLPDGRAMPAGSDWLSAGVTFELRPTRTLMLRVGVGRAWLMNTGDFGVFTRNELAYAQSQYGVVPGVNPLDAARASLDGETLSMWYAHVDIAPAWRW